MDVEKYGITLTLDGAATVNAGLDSVAAKGEQSAQRITSAFSKTSRSVATEATASQRALAAQGVTLEQVMAAANGKAVAVADATKQLAVAQESAAKSSGVHGLQLGRLNQELGTFIGRLTGTNTAVTRLGAQIGGAFSGYAQMIAILAVISLVAAAYEKLTESERNAAKEQEHLNKVRQDFLDKQGRPAGEFGASQTNLSESVARDAKRIADLTVQRDSALTDGATEKANALNNQLIALSKTYAKNAADLRVMTDEKDRLVTSSKLETDLAAIEVQHQNALNDAYGKGSVTIARINADYALQATLKRDAAQYLGEERVLMDALAQSTHDAAIRAAENAAGVGELRSKLAELAADMPALQAGFDALAPSILYVNHLWQDQLQAAQALKDAYPDIAKNLNDIATANKKVADAQVNDAAKAIEKQAKYAQDMRDIWRSGIGKIATDGLKSFQDFFEDVNQLFLRLLERMEREGKANGLAGKLLGIGAAATGGYSIGTASGSGAIGALGGAAAGFAIAGPLGALAGGIAGLTGGLIGGAAAARQRKEAEDSLRASLVTSQAQIRNQLGLLSDVAYAQIQAHDTFAKFAKDINDAYPGKKNEQERENLLRDNASLEQQYIQYLKDQATATAAAAKAAEDAARAQDQLRNAQAQGGYQQRYLTANGNSDAAFALQQKLELQDAANQGYTPETIALLTLAQQAEREQREREKQTALLQDQLSTAQQSLQSLQQVYDSLDQFSKSLTVGQYSPLSPRQQLDAARGQLNSLYKSALGGDVNAGNQFSSVAQQFLDSSRKYNASGAGYVLDFNSVSVMTDALKTAFGTRVDAAQQQVDLLTKQLSALQEIRDAIVSRPGLVPVDRLGTQPVSRGTGASLDTDAFTQAVVATIVDRMETLTEAVEQSGRDTRVGLDGITQRLSA